MLVADLINALQKRGLSPQLWPAQAQLRDVDLARACFDSRRVQPGDIFCAIPGHSQQGADFIQSALDAQASMLLVDQVREQFSCPQLVVGEELALTAAHCADLLAGRPSSKMWCAAITGTNGKTTVAHLVRGALEQLDIKAASCGTLGMIDRKGITPNLNTTPAADIVHGWLAELAEAQYGAVIVEASSHGIVQHRVTAVDFDCVAFTNLSHEHLDYHHTLEKYAAAKMQLINSLPSTAIAFVPHSKMLIDLCSSAAAEIMSWSSCEAQADVVCGITESANGVQVTFDWEEQQGVIHSALCGYHNGENLFLAALMMLSRGLPIRDVCSALSSQPAADGRLEQVTVHQGLAFVDYAHTPDALEKVLMALRASHPKCVLKVVFGAGGDRDNAKRKAMGSAVSNHADWCVLTSDNPRTESPESIIEQVAAGIDEGALNFHSIVERDDAIRFAVESLGPNDVLVVAGKGHETYQEINGVRHSFDDRLQIREAVQCLA
ncbi:MAG: UDP-N-acetylmuramoyl-L-alanyl-D-glutamate--2,6-diaminopimelate ligase [Planctomycetota bacterium]|jgi:UDP-N-acetylmuramyl-tripeptide synthetase